MAHRPSLAFSAFATALTALAALAGCADPAPAASPAQPALSFAAAVAMPQPTDGGEPTIAIAPDGTLWITAKAGNQDKPSMYEGASWLWRSTDGGATWDTVRSPIRAIPTTPMTREPVRASDPDVVATGDGWVYYLDWWIPRNPVLVSPPVGLPVGPTTNFIVERTNDGGVTWEKTPVTIPADEGMGVDRPWLVANDEGFVGIAYNGNGGLHGSYPQVPGGAPGLRFTASHDRAATWSTPVTAVEETPGTALLIGRPALLPSGRILMPYGELAYAEDGYVFDDPAEVRVAYSDDQGASWRNVPVAAAPGGFDQIWPVQGATAPDGSAAITWSSREAGRLVLRVATTPDGGATWSEPAVVRSDGTSALPWIAMMDAQRMAVGYFHGDYEGDPRNASSNVAWYAQVSETRDGGATWVTATAGDGPVKMGRFCPIGTFCERERVSDRELLDYVGLAYAPDGTLHYSWTESRDLADGLKDGHVHYAHSA